MAATAIAGFLMTGELALKSGICSRYRLYPFALLDGRGYSVLNKDDMETTWYSSSRV